MPKSIQIQNLKFPLLWKHCHVKQEKYHSDSSQVLCRLLDLHPLVCTHAHTSRDKPADAGPPGSRFAQTGFSQRETDRGVFIKRMHRNHFSLVPRYQALDWRLRWRRGKYPKALLLFQIPLLGPFLAFQHSLRCLNSFLLPLRALSAPSALLCLLC